MGTVAEQFGKLGTRAVVVSSGMQLIVNHVSYGKVSIESVLAGDADAVAFTATEDGRHYIAEWARGEEDSGDAVYCERWTDAGRVFHGWIDVVSRKIVQAG